MKRNKLIEQVVLLTKRKTEVKKNVSQVPLAIFLSLKYSIFSSEQHIDFPLKDQPEWRKVNVSVYAVLGILKRTKICILHNDDG